MSLLWMALEKATGLHDVYIEQHAIYTNLFFIPAVLVYVLTLRDKKYNFYNADVSYNQLFISGLIMSLMIALLAPLSTFVSVEYLSPEYFDNAIKMSVKNKIMSQTEAEEYSIQPVICSKI